MNNFPRLPESLINDHLEEMKVDVVGLWQLVDDAEKEFGLEDAIQIQEVVIDAVKRLLAHNVAAISYHPEKKAYEVWSTEPSFVIARLKEEWGKLGHVPQLGEDGGISFIDKGKLPLLKTIP